jgi:hypothetical protein
MTLRLTVLALTMVASVPWRASAQPSHTTAAIGTWRGTSICMVRPSPCNDEHVVYRVSALPARDSVAVDARKIVNGQEEEMGVLRCGVAATRPQVTCSMPNGVWRLEVRGDSLVGDLRLPNDTKYRDVRTARSR